MEIVPHKHNDLMNGVAHLKIRFQYKIDFDADCVVKFWFYCGKRPDVVINFSRMVYS